MINIKVLFGFRPDNCEKVEEIFDLPNEYTDKEIEEEHQEWVNGQIDGWWQKLPEPKKIIGCTVTDCWHYLLGVRYDKS